MVSAKAHSLTYTSRFLAPVVTSLLIVSTRIGGGTSMAVRMPVLLTNRVEREKMSSIVLCDSYQLPLASG
jgi:hypothetical protein